MVTINRNTGGGGFKKPGGGNARPGGKKPAGGGSRGKNNKPFAPKVFNDPNSEDNIKRREDNGIKRGRVVEALPNAMFRIEYEDGTKGLGMIGGKLKVYKIRILVGDMVEAVIDPYSKKGRIVKRG